MRRQTRVTKSRYNWLSWSVTRKISRLRCEKGLVSFLCCTLAPQPVLKQFQSVARISLHRTCPDINSKGQSMVGHLFKKLWHDIRAVFSHVYLQSFLLHDIHAFFLSRIFAFFPALWGFYSQVYDHFLTNAHIYAHKKVHIYVLQTSMWYMGSQKVVV